MREIIDNVVYDDEFEPVEMVISQGEYNDVSSTHYAIQLEVGFDEEMEDILTEHDLEMSGYILESIVEVFLETENPTLLEAIIGQESEDATLVLYADTEENQRSNVSSVSRRGLLRAGVGAATLAFAGAPTVAQPPMVASALV